MNLEQNWLSESVIFALPRISSQTRAVTIGSESAAPWEAPSILALWRWLMARTLGSWSGQTKKVVIHGVPMERSIQLGQGERSTRDLCSRSHGMKCPQMCLGDFKLGELRPINLLSNLLFRTMEFLICLSFHIFAQKSVFKMFPGRFQLMVWVFQVKDIIKRPLKTCCRIP